TSRPPPSSPLFPYPTLFRSELPRAALGVDVGVAGRPVVSIAIAAAAGLLVRRGVRVVGHDVAQVPRPRHRGAEKHADDLGRRRRSEEHTSELQSLTNLVCRL